MQFYLLKILISAAVFTLITALPLTTRVLGAFRNQALTLPCIARNYPPMKIAPISLSLGTFGRALPLLAIAALWCGCSTPANRQGQPLLDPFPPGGNGAALPVERVSAGAGRIMTASVDTIRNGFEVHGLEGRRTFAAPSPGAHIDVLLLDSRGQVLESVAVAYPPNAHPFRYSALLATRKAPAGATVKVVFHDAQQTANEAHHTVNDG